MALRKNSKRFMGIQAYHSRLKEIQAANNNCSRDEAIAIYNREKMAGGNIAANGNNGESPAISAIAVGNQFPNPADYIQWAGEERTKIDVEIETLKNRRDILDKIANCNQ
jgi:hypothetical protein